VLSSSPKQVKKEEGKGKDKRHECMSDGQAGATGGLFASGASNDRSIHELDILVSTGHVL
jgi:hypothetical protein